MTQYWIMKSEPSTYSIDQLKKDKSTLWEGVRNFQARNFMMNDMKVGDMILFYHSSCEVPGIAGIAKVIETAKPDPSQFDRKGDFFEKRATTDKPVWHCVTIGFEKKFSRVIELKELKQAQNLAELLLLRPGNRLSITPLEKKHYDFITTLE